MTTLRPALLALLLLGSASPAALAQDAARAPTATTPARQLFVIIYRPGAAWVAGRPMAQQDLRPHGAYYQRLMDEGRVFAGGGFSGTEGGLAIIRAADAEEAQAILAADPAIQSGVFAADLRQWRPRFHSEARLVELPR